MSKGEAEGNSGTVSTRSAGTDNDELGPELVARVYDPETGMTGILVVDNSVLGPVGGGTRMALDVDELEVRQLARAMTFKFAFLGLPRGGSKAGIIGDPNMPAADKRAYLRAFGNGLRSFLRTKEVAVGPDMGVTVEGVSQIYEGAGVEQLRTGLFSVVVDGDPAGYHITGRGVINTAVASCGAAKIPFVGSRVAVEGFGQVGVGTCRAAVREGAKVVAISTLEGALFNAGGLDVEELMALRRQHGDRCIHHYDRAERIDRESIYFLPVEIVVPGARPWVITEENCDRVQAKMLVSAGNITCTNAAQEKLWSRGVICVPDFVANAAGLIGSLVDFFGGTVEQAFRAIDSIMGPRAAEVATDALRRNETMQSVAIERATQRILAHRGQPRRTFDEAKPEIGRILGL
jgi:glutamate dehydrogenase (NAD(P)+)